MQSDPELYIPEARTHRFKALKPAVIRITGQSAPIHCIVTDSSKGRLRIVLDNANHLPTHFRIALINEDFDRSCELAWQSDLEASLKFID